MIREVKISDADRIAEIYNYYIEHTIITFEEKQVTAEEMRQRIKSILEKNYPYIVYEERGLLTAYAYLNNWRLRSAYNRTLETSIYVDIEYSKKGQGSVLYKELIEKAKAANIHSLIAGISLPNDISRKLHEKFGFHLVGNFRESGFKFNRWIDTEFWQLMLE
ncbi:MAG: N-acetyltransferase family protein [Candidatus Azobacteroides sp.]|nr:N-acetyltransferase family protein [Candidatus Azobacteroides sp.]